MAYKGIKIPEGATKAIKAGGVTIWQADTGGGLPIFNPDDYVVNESLVITKCGFRGTSYSISGTPLLSITIEGGSKECTPLIVNADTKEIMVLSKQSTNTAGTLVYAFISLKDSNISKGTLTVNAFVLDGNGHISSTYFTASVTIK